ncbi:MFS general substrate transporter [Wilcoxina mikolae CBS 423.85]|nr:MFS general substrate transporter [Wilcoxina mikolae CBS 423.85]
MAHNERIEPGKWKCLDVVRLVYAAAPLQIITDFAVLLLPMPILSSLQLPWKQRAMLMVIFGAGGFVAVLQVVRAYYFQKASKCPDFGWPDAISFLWAEVTVYVGIVAASMPMLKPLITRYLPGRCGFVEGYVSVQPVGSQDNQFIRISTPPLDPRLSPTPSVIVTPPYLEPSVSPRSEAPTSGQIASLPPEPNAVGIHTAWSVIPTLALISGPFFLWGLSNGLVSMMYKKFEAIREISERQALAIGLFIFGGGCMCFWPCVVQHSYSGIAISLAVVGAGCGTMETATNPFAALIGPQEYAEVRLNFLKGIQGIGGLVVILVETTNFYASVDTMSYSALKDVQWIYLSCGFAAFIVAGFFCCVKLPELKDSERSFANSSRALFKGRYGISFVLAILTLFFYTGCQEIISLYARNVLVGGLHRNATDALIYKKTARGLFAAGNFVGALMMLVFRPRWVLLVFMCALIITGVVEMTQPGSLGVAGFILNRFFQSIVFPTVFVLAIRGVGRHIKTATAFLISCISGGAALPAAYYALREEKGPRYALCICVAAYAVMIVYPLWLSLSPFDRERTKRVDEDKQQPVSAMGNTDGSNGELGFFGMIGDRKRRKSSLGVVGFSKHVELSSGRGTPL